MDLGAKNTLAIIIVVCKNKKTVCKIHKTKWLAMGQGRDGSTEVGVAVCSGGRGDREEGHDEGVVQGGTWVGLGACTFVAV